MLMLPRTLTLHLRWLCRTAGIHRLEQESDVKMQEL